MEDKIRALALAMVKNRVDVCGPGMFSGAEIAKKVLRTLNEEGYDIVEQQPKNMQ